MKREKEFEAKKDCFAYDKKNNDCKALKELYCEFEKCSYYKKKKEGGKQ